MDKIPPVFEDFPYSVQQGISVFGRLGDKVVADVGYLGKDYTLLPLYIEASEIPDLEMFLETLARLDERVKKKSREDMKRQRDALKSKK